MLKLALALLVALSLAACGPVSGSRSFDEGRPRDLDNPHRGA